MAATSIYVDPVTQAEIDMLSGIIYVLYSDLEWFIELSTWFPNGLFFLLRMLWFLLYDERSSLERGIEVYGVNEGVERKCWVWSEEWWLDTGNASIAPKSSGCGAMEWRHGDSAFNRNCLPFAWFIQIEHHFQRDILVLYGCSILHLTILPFSKTKWFFIIHSISEMNSWNRTSSKLSSPMML